MSIERERRVRERERKEGGKITHGSAGKGGKKIEGSMMGCS